MTKIAVFASGSGSNLEALLQAVKAGRLAAKIELVVCDKPGAYCLKRAALWGVPYLVFDPAGFASKAGYEKLIWETLKPLGVQYLILAGYLRLIGPTLLERYPKRIINIHPSLLPQFPGLDAIGQALAAGVNESGVTIHYVDQGIDTGPIIAQKKVVLSPAETRASLEAKIHRLEHRLYPEVLQRIFQSEGGELC
ncbi:MAG TPA: phosphoribosylglycinamide formyltransferase [Firmicutes bacterium]|nr:phosphoribosylglycinamide formyltransferase [Bacillota bacterium]